MTRTSIHLAIALSLLGCTVDASNGAPARPLITRQAPEPPLIIRIAEKEAREVLPRNYIHYAVPLPDRVCILAGRIEGITGGATADFEALIMDDDNYRNWMANVSATAIESGRKVVWTFSRSVKGPGVWHVVVSNRFSLLSPLAVTTSATATCAAAGADTSLATPHEVVRR